VSTHNVKHGINVKKINCYRNLNALNDIFFQILLSPQKPVISRHLSMITNETTVNHEELHNGPGLSSSIVTPTEALFAAVECVSAYQDAATNRYSPELQTLLSNIRFNGQHSGQPHWPPIGGCVEIAAQLARQQPCRVAPVGGTKMVSKTG
jgi:hypothetical protein